jgi:hypothetical protein
MFDQNGLSLDQAPPVSVVFGLFLMGAFWGILTGIAILYYRSDIFDFSSTGALVITHLMTLGVMMGFMLGALFQMLPVIAGVILEAPIPRSNLIKVLLLAGTLTLLSGFITHSGILFLFASILLGASLLYVAVAMGSKLWKLSHHSASSRGMLFSMISLLILVLLALYMTLTYAGLVDGTYFLAVKQIHYSFGLFGWIALLIVSISFQTIEMFYVTPAYPKLLTRMMPMGIVSLLALLSLLLLLESSVSSWIQLLLYLSLILYAGFTLLRLSQRKRPLADATMWFWRTGMGSLILSMFLLIADLFVSQHLLVSLATILFASFILSVLFAMFYKIVPFLTWFHLNAQGYFTAPMMHEVIHPKTAKKHYYIHLGTLLLFLLSLIFPQAILLAGVGMILSFTWVGYQILHANKLYKHTQETGEKFDMVMMGQ